MDSQSATVCIAAKLGGRASQVVGERRLDVPQVGEARMPGDFRNGKIRLTQQVFSSFIPGASNLGSERGSDCFGHSAFQPAAADGNLPQHVGDTDRTVTVLTNESNRRDDVGVVDRQNVGRTPHRDADGGKQHVLRHRPPLVAQEPLNLLDGMAGRCRWWEGQSTRATVGPPNSRDRRRRLPVRQCPPGRGDRSCDRPG